MSEDAPLTAEEQKAITAITLEQIYQQTDLRPDTLVTLELEFAPDPDADEAPCQKALGMFGYAAIVGSEGQIIVTVPNTVLELEAIWLHEQRTTTIATARGYKPDGWGFWEP